jgi:hypothetical protein
MIVTAKLLDQDGTPYTGPIVVRSAAGVALKFGLQFGGRPSALGRLDIADGDVQIEIPLVSEAIVSAADGSCAMRVIDGQQFPTQLGASSGSLSIAAEYEGSVSLTLNDEILAISGQLTALASAGASCCTLMHIPAADRSVLVAVEGVLGLATLNTSGGVVLASAPSEGDVIEFLGSTII